MKQMWHMQIHTRENGIRNSEIHMMKQRKMMIAVDELRDAKQRKDEDG